MSKIEGAFDDQAERVSQQLDFFPGVSLAKAGKYFQLEISETDPDKAKLLVEEMCKALIVSSVYESHVFKIE